MAISIKRTADTAKQAVTEEQSNGYAKAVDVPVGIAVRVNEAVRPWRNAPRVKAESELKRYRNKLQYELNVAERRGTEARKRFERQVRSQREKLETRIRRSRNKAAEQVSA
jgi:hypothetical protein